MAGHSKWANIQHRKGRQDAKRGKVFTRLIKEITVAARLGGSDPASNARLRLAVDKAYAANMPKDTVERATKRGSGELEGVNYEEIRYEGYGIGGAAVIVDCMTDNRVRTVADVRHAFAKNGGNLGTEGSVAFLFKHCGQLLFAPGTSEEKVMSRPWKRAPTTSSPMTTAASRSSPRRMIFFRSRTNCKNPVSGRKWQRSP